jgi:hypothetical protein
MRPLRSALGLIVPLQLLTPQRWWLEQLAMLVPGSAATRWLLVADAACLVALGLASRRPLLGVPLALSAGFLVLNVLGMVLTDFYLGLAVFHLVVGVGTAAMARQTRWLGLALVVLALGLGVLT